MTRDRLRRRDFVNLLGAAGAGAALALSPSGWAAPVTPAQAAKGLLVRPYLQPGPAATSPDLDAKDVLWLTDPRGGGGGGEFTVEYGWDNAPPRTAAVHRNEIRLK